MNSIIITCEHAGNTVPEKFCQLFEGREEVLNTHRGFDPGALALANLLSKELEVPLFYQLITRLLIEMNRSLQSPHLFSEFTRSLKDDQKDELLKNYYHPYRNQVIESIDAHLQDKLPVLHLSIHSFTPVLDGEVRQAEIGVLFDPARQLEKNWSENFISKCRNALPGFRIVSNYPYAGTDDGFTTNLRTIFPESYLGIELEFNQAILTDEFVMNKGKIIAELLK
jgi:predicted N-formylglutamate amidohydrolase